MQSSRAVNSSEAGVRPGSPPQLCNPPAKCERIVAWILARLRGKYNGCVFRCKVQVGRIFPTDNPVVHMRQTGIIQYVEWQGSQAVVCSAFRKTGTTAQCGWAAHNNLVRNSAERPQRPVKPPSYPREADSFVPGRSNLAAAHPTNIA